MTPIWVLIVVAVIAALSGAAVGAVITQIGVARAATTMWNREEKRRAEQRAHEDHQLTFVERQRAYVELSKAVQMVRYTARISFETGFPRPHPDLSDQIVRLLEKVTPVEMFGSQEVTALSWKVLNHAAFFDLDSRPSSKRAADYGHLSEDAEALMARIRVDLHVERPPAELARAGAAAAL